MTIKLLPHFRRNKSSYTNNDEVYLILRVFVDGKRMNISTGIKFSTKIGLTIG